jgi:alpha-L-fucosidase 2
MKFALLVLLTATFLPARALQDVEYSQASGQSLRMDASIPDGPGPYPAAIIVHGGAWVTGDKQRSVRPLFKPLADGGVAWFSINYRLARGSDPASLITLEGLAALSSASDDVRNAVEYVRSHAEEWNIDPARIVLIGESAGAHLASMAALKASPGERVKAVVAFYSPSDLVKLIDSNPRIPEILRRAVKGSPLEALLMSGLKQLSPQTWVSKDSPPFLMIHGTADQLVPFEQSEDMCGALTGLGVSCEVVAVPGAGHGMNFWEGQPAMMAYKPKMMDWVRQQLQ